MITGDGLIEAKEDPITKRKYRLLNLPVQINGRDLVYTPDKDAIIAFNIAFGNDTLKWIGHKFTLKFYPKTIFGKKKTAIMPVFLDIKIK